jgi:uncharacterized membrane protein
MMLGFSLLVLLILGGVVLVLVVGGGRPLSQSGTFRASDAQRWRTPREVLDRRLARGEIDREEYEAIRARIER